MVQPTDTPTKLAYEDLWAAWTPLTDAEKEAIKTSAKVGADASLDAKLSDLRVGGKSSASLAVRQDLVTKLDLYRDLVNFYARDDKDDRFKKVLGQLKGPGMKAFDLKLRVERAIEGKEAASKKYKDGNWFGAMYTYAIAWGCLVPYYPDALDAGKPLVGEINKLEHAIFSNISAMAVTGAEDKTLKPKQRAQLMHLGLRASVYCLTQAESGTVGIVQKSCRRAADLSDKLSTRHKTIAASPALIALFKKQEMALQGMEAGKAFRDVPEGKKVLQAGEGGFEVGGWEVYDIK